MTVHYLTPARPNRPRQVVIRRPDGSTESRIIFETVLIDSRVVIAGDREGYWCLPPGASIEEVPDGWAGAVYVSSPGSVYLGVYATRAQQLRVAQRVEGPLPTRRSRRSRHDAVWNC